MFSFKEFQTGNVTARPTAQTTTSARALVSGGGAPGRRQPSGRRSPPSFLRRHVGPAQRRAAAPREQRRRSAPGDRPRRRRRRRRRAPRSARKCPHPARPGPTRDGNKSPVKRRPGRAGRPGGGGGGGGSAREHTRLLLCVRPNHRDRLRRLARYSPPRDRPARPPPAPPSYIRGPASAAFDVRPRGRPRRGDPRSTSPRRGGRGPRPLPPRPAPPRSELRGAGRRPRLLPVSARKENGGPPRRRSGHVALRPQLGASGASAPRGCPRAARSFVRGKPAGTRGPACGADSRGRWGRQVTSRLAEAKRDRPGVTQSARVFVFVHAQNTLAVKPFP
ncbi:translation initiation factor IF-2-like [Canis lupus dingo]|uniref:translation initiation factor IF-2-like n=1 Tax=Canis lupus dingo TaxID=286419 RepID=UPI0020C33112|nr:translation initiation factor IF-2-like [Canis lupus dingo]